MAIEQRLKKSYDSNGGKNVSALPWAAIVEALMSLFGNCPAKRTKRWAKLHPVAAKSAIDEKLKEEGTFTSNKDRKAAVDAAYDTFIKTSDSELESMR